VVQNESINAMYFFSSMQMSEIRQRFKKKADINPAKEVGRGTPV
jgi:hypothetical protein